MTETISKHRRSTSRAFRTVTIPVAASVDIVTPDAFASAFKRLCSSLGSRTVNMVVGARFGIGTKVVKKSDERNEKVLVKGIYLV